MVKTESRGQATQCIPRHVNRVQDLHNVESHKRVMQQLSRYNTMHGPTCLMAVHHVLLECDKAHKTHARLRPEFELGAQLTSSPGSCPAVTGWKARKVRIDSLSDRAQTRRV